MSDNYNGRLVTDNKYNIMIEELIRLNVQICLKQ